MIYSSDLKKSSWQCVHFAEGEQAERVKLELADSLLTCFECDVTGIKNDVNFFDSVSTSLSFPDYFGCNWDALEECLVDMELDSGKGLVLFVVGAKHLWCDAIYTGGKLISVWQAAAQQWGDEDIPFHIIFVI